jgi:hypothetical protein
VFVCGAGFNFSFLLFQNLVLTKKVHFCVVKFETGKEHEPEQETCFAFERERYIYWFLAVCCREIKPCCGVVGGQFCKVGSGEEHIGLLKLYFITLG